MVPARIEYLGFSTRETSREYRLRVQASAGDFRDFTLAIPCSAFLDHRVRYQDAPEICFLKLQRALGDSADGLPSAQLAVSDAELEEYRVAHAPKPTQRRPKPPVTPITS